MDTQEIIAVVIGAPLLGWALLTAVQHAKQIATLRSGHEAIISSLNETKDDLRGVRNELIKIENRIDLFLKTEIDTMKEIARENTLALNRLADK